MSAEELISRLTLPEKERLYGLLRTSIRQDKEAGETRRLEETMKEVSGIVIDLMGIECYEPARRDRPYFVSRVIIANFLLLKGFTETKVGMVMGKDHSTINGLKKNLDAWVSCPNMYREELNYWNKLKQIYEIDR